jgi:hypothetical protein
MVALISNDLCRMKESLFSINPGWMILNRLFSLKLDLVSDQRAQKIAGILAGS